ncbi:ATP-binding protein, partial [uncultured Phocaeicola sp.]
MHPFIGSRRKLEPSAFLDRIAWKESVRRRECRRKSRIKSAGFPQMKYLHELVMEDMPKEAQVILPELETLDFIREGRNIVLYGNPGTGNMAHLYYIFTFTTGQYPLNSSCT